MKSGEIILCILGYKLQTYHRNNLSGFSNVSAGAWLGEWGRASGGCAAAGVGSSGAGGG